MLKLTRPAIGARVSGYETRPAFASSWITPESYGEEDVAARYSVGDIQVTILSPPGLQPRSLSR